MTAAPNSPTFPGINLTPEALALRQQADAMQERIYQTEELLANDGLPPEHRTTGQTILEAMKQHVARIEREITVVPATRG